MIYKCFTVTECINDNEVQADRIYQSFNQILIITYGNCVANTNKRHTKLFMVSSDCKINMKLLMVAPILFLVFVGDGKFTSGKFGWKIQYKSAKPAIRHYFRFVK